MNNTNVTGLDNILFFISIQSAVNGTPRELLARGPRRRRTPNLLMDQI